MSIERKPEKITLRVDKFLRLRSAEIVLKEERPKRIVLYGPNAAGKSSILYTLLLLADPQKFCDIVKINDTTRYIRDARFAIKIEDKILMGVKDGKYICSDREEENYDLIESCIKEVFRKLGINVITYVRGDNIHYLPLHGNPKPSFNINDHTSWAEFLEDPEEMEEILKDWCTYLGVVNVYISPRHETLVKVKVNEDEKWIDITMNAYGLRRAMAIMYFAKKSDLLMVDVFESGLHHDLIVDLLKWLKDIAKYVIIETHSSTVALNALNEEWDVYYIDAGKAERITTYEDLRKTELFKREAELYYLA